MEGYELCSGTSQVRWFFISFNFVSCTPQYPMTFNSKNHTLFCSECSPFTSAGVQVTALVMLNLLTGVMLEMYSLYYTDTKTHDDDHEVNCHGNCLLQLCLCRNLSACLSLSQPVSTCLNLSQPVSTSQPLPASHPVSDCLSLSASQPLNLSASLSPSQPLSTYLSLSQPISAPLSVSEPPSLSISLGAEFVCAVDVWIDHRKNEEF